MERLCALLVNLLFTTVLSLKAVLSSRMRDSTMAWFADHLCGLFAVRPPVSHLSFSLALLRGVLLNVARTLCHLRCIDFLLNVARLPCLTYRGLRALPARLSLQALSSQARHWLEVRTIMFWTMRFRIALLLSWDFWVRPCMHAATSWASRGDSGDSPGPLLIHILTLWNICTRFSFAARSHWVTLKFFGLHRWRRLE